MNLKVKPRQPVVTKKLVLIQWDDPCICSAHWKPLDDKEEPEAIHCMSVGWLLKDGKKTKVVVPHVAQDGDQGFGDMTLPVGCIRRIVELVPKQRKKGKSNG